MAVRGLHGSARSCSQATGPISRFSSYHTTVKWHANLSLCCSNHGASMSSTLSHFLKAQRETLGVAAGQQHFGSDLISAAASTAA